MREILFKAKIAGTDGWVFGLPYSVYDVGIDSILAPGHEIEYIDVDTICQFTGITDKNGVKIFADDLRKIEDGGIIRIYCMGGGFALKANYWGNDILDLVGSDFLIMEGLTDAQTRDWIINSTEAAGNIHE